MATTKQHAEAERLVGFRIGNVAYAVRIGAVKEIINPIPLTELPHAPTSVAGVADHRGAVVPVIALRARFGLPAPPNPERCKWILVAIEQRTVGLMVDQVTEVFSPDEEGLRPAPDLGGGEDERGIEGVTIHGGEMVFVLDVSRFRDLALALGRPGAGAQEPG
jgi:purine-binding chemotaxis protein CheW